MYDESLRCTQDADMLARLAKRFPLIRVPEALMQIREHEHRGIRSKNCEREAYKFFRDRLNEIPLEELFSNIGRDATKLERAKAYLWLADSFAINPLRLYRKIAKTQYLNALTEYPAVLPSLIRHYITSFLRRSPQLYKLGLRTALTRKFNSARGITD